MVTKKEFLVIVLISIVVQIMCYYIAEILRNVIGW